MQVIRTCRQELALHLHVPFMDAFAGQLQLFAEICTWLHFGRFGCSGFFSGGLFAVPPIGQVQLNCNFLQDGDASCRGLVGIIQFIPDSSRGRKLAGVKTLGKRWSARSLTF